MVKNKPADLEVKTFATHKVITQPNALTTGMATIL
jgi:hypothetical protein